MISGSRESREKRWQVWQWEHRTGFKAYDVRAQLGLGLMVDVDVATFPPEVSSSILGYFIMFHPVLSVLVFFFGLR